MPNDIVVQERGQIEPITPQAMIQQAFQKAIEQGAALEVVDRILEQQKWLMQHSEQEAFHAALRRIQDDLQAIAKRGDNPDTHSSFATAQDIDGAINGLLKRERMSLSFEPRISDKPEMVLIVGILSLGAYSKEYPLEMPADGKGPKGGGVMSRTHATGSAITYAKRYLKGMIFNLLYKEPDDDGNAAGRTDGGRLSEPRLVEILDGIKEAPNKKELFRLSMAALEECTNVGDMQSQREIMKARDNRLEDIDAGRV